ncbi:MAG: hypothetical protein Q4A37_00505 [Candidatus Saccharibacteria bacterium]|nr:hypothetical protein [Candidatus Saccharibacteria bacterium]
MAKVKKKRTKKYSGVDASSQQPSIRRISAVQRSRLGQWLHDKRPLLKAIGTMIGIILLIALLIAGISSLFTRPS